MKDNLMLMLLGFALGFSFKTVVIFDRFEQKVKKDNFSACTTGYTFGRAEEHFKKPKSEIPQICKSYNL